MDGGSVSTQDGAGVEAASKQCVGTLRMKEEADLGLPSRPLRIEMITQKTCSCYVLCEDVVGAQDCLMRCDGALPSDKNAKPAFE